MARTLILVWLAAAAGAALGLGVGLAAERPIEAAIRECGPVLQCRVAVLDRLGDESQAARYLRELSRRESTR